MMIDVYTENSQNVWIPVAEGKDGIGARALLPFNGLDGNYRFGFKGEIIEAGYFEALRRIQQAYIDKERKLFNTRSRNEWQSKAKWRHRKEDGWPLLGPTRGWVLVPLTDLETLSDVVFEEALAKSSSRYAILESRTAPPVLCECIGELERESSRLLREFSGKVPAGQAKPKKIHGSVDQFVRDAAVVAYVLREADGQCECCTKPAPFFRSNRNPYLEVHHVLPLASGGSDRVSNAIAVCPNCHRELHYGENAEYIVKRLYSCIARLEID